MFNDTVTIFNKVGIGREQVYWYVNVLHNVETQLKKGENAMKSGNENANSLYLSIPLISSNSDLFADGVKYLKPKEYKALADKSGTFTLAENDFVAIGDYSNLLVGTYIDDESQTGGLYGYMKKTYDDVYNIVTIDEFKGIRHLEVGGK